MADENTAATPVDTSPSFADAVAEITGDYLHLSAEPDEDAGDPPADSPETDDTDAEPTGDTPDAAATPEQTEVPVDDDPLKDATDATYRVNGEARTFDGIRVLSDKSGFIEPDKMDLVLHRLSERDHLFETAQSRQQELSDLQAAHQAATRWTLADGKVVTGSEGARARDLDYAVTRAERDTWNALLSDPATVFGLLAQDANGNVTWNTPAVELVMAQLENKKLQLTHAVKEFHGQRPSTSAPTSGAPSAPPAAAVADHLVQSLGVKGFGDTDKQWVASLAEDMIRPATATDVAKNPALKVGEFFAPPKLIDLIRDREALLARSAKQVASASTIDKENQAKLAAANRGKKPVAPVKAAPKQAADDEPTAFDSWYDRQQDAAAGLMRTSA